MKTILLAAMALGLAGCMTTTPASRGPDEEPLQKMPAGTCDAAPAQVHLGKVATGELGAQILAETTARRLRWGPPDSAWTMDYRDDRVNVRYDREMIITGITCG